MTTNYDVLTFEQFLMWLDKQQIKRKITWMAWHHTYSPNTADVKKKGFAYYVKAVQKVHMGRGWQDQAQHINVNNADGTIILGRSWELDGGGILSDPKGDITTEIFADFDSEQMTDACKKTVLGIAWACSKKFGIPLNETGHKYHYWFDLKTGKELKDGEAGSRKTCPGKNFFGGFTRKAFNETFLPALIEYGKPVDPKQQRIAETVAGLTSTKRKDGVTAVSLDGAYWTKVFNGEVVASPENVMVIMRRLMKMEQGMRICHCTAPYLNPNACRHCSNNNNTQEYEFLFDATKTNYKTEYSWKDYLKSFVVTYDDSENTTKKLQQSLQN